MGGITVTHERPELASATLRHRIQFAGRGQWPALADKPTGWSGRGHFFGAAAEAMRRILVERARKRRTRKRGGDRKKIRLDAAEPFVDPDPDELLGLDEALQRLENQDRRMSEVVKLRCFAGLTMEEIARALDLSPRTVHREWAVARAWLRGEIDKGDDDAR